MRRFIINWLALTSILMVSACGVGSNPGLPVNHDLGPITEQMTDGVTVTLDAPVWLWDERIRYRLLYDDATAIRYYNLDRWEASLPALLERRLTVTSSRQPILLQIHLTQFEQQFKTANSARVLMNLSVSALAAEDNSLLGKRSFRLSQKAVSPDAGGAIAGFVALTEQAKVDIQNWLETLSDK